MKKNILILFIILVSMNFIFAKRLPPPEVNSICIKDVKYGVVYSSSPCFTAILKIENDQEIKTITIYKKILNPFLEADIQYVYIKEMKLVEDSIIQFTNENNEIYLFNIKTCKITQIKQK